MSVVGKLVNRATFSVREVRPKHPLRWIAMRSLGRFVALRPGLSTVLSHRYEISDEKGSLFPNANSEKIVREINDTGFASGLDLPPDVSGKITNFLLERDCYANGDRKTIPCKWEEVERTGAVTGYYFNLGDCSEVRAIIDDAKIRNIAASYFNSTPIHLGNQSWWSFVRDSSEADKSAFAQLYHFDLDDFRFLKFFFYLTDVDSEADGAHEYVLKTHNRRAFSHQWQIRRFSDKEVCGSHAPSQKLTVLEKKGSGFVEDTFGLHKGNPPTQNPRLYFEIEFGISDFGVPNDLM